MIPIPISPALRTALLILVSSIQMSGCDDYNTIEMRDNREMHSSRVSQEKLVDIIRQAFTGVKYPGDSKIVIPSKFDFDIERKEIRDYFCGRTWDKCSVRDKLYFNSASLPCLTPEGYQYFLPAFMIACVMEYEEADLIPETLVSSLSPPISTASEADMKDFTDRIGALNKKQMHAIKCFLEFLAQEYPDEYASDHVMGAIAYYDNMMR